MRNHILKIVFLLPLLIFSQMLHAQIGKCKGKYLGNIIAGSVPSNYSTYWNQVTSENGSKWGSVEGTKGVYNFNNSDLAYNWAKNNGGLFKYHTLIWGAQTPGWVNTASTDDIRLAIEPYFIAVKNHYNPLGGLKMIDVLNEPVNTPMPGNLKAALTAGYRAEPANANDLNNQYGWAIWCFQLARKHFPDAVLLINEYNVEMNWNNCRAPYIAMTQAIKNAPNLTDGRKNLIDGVGLQAHGINNLTAANFKACIDEIWNKTGVSIHITEFDQTADPNEAKQQQVYSSLIPVAWEHPHVAGITFWGYIQGQTWIRGNGQTGASGTDSGIIYANGTERPAMTWLKQYFASQPSLTCCPAPAPFGSCTTTNPSPVVSISSPANNSVLTEGDNITINATVSISSGSITKVDFYNGTTLLGTDATSPYSYTMSGAVAGNYVITAKATSNLNVETTSSVVNVQVAKIVYQTGTAPVIDGTIEGLWSNYPSTSIGKLNNGTVSSATDLSGNWKSMWDATNLYVLVQVTDDVKRNDGGTDVYNDDNVEIYMDMFNTKGTTYGTNDHQYTFRWNDATAVYEINGHSVTGITRVITNTTTGYVLEVSIPWSTIGGTVAVNNLHGFEVMINDDDDGGARDGKMAWIASVDDTWSNPSLMGTIVLRGLNCTPPSSTITTTTATTFCQGGSVTLNANTGTGFTYQWKNGTTNITGGTTSSYTATTGGSYSVTVTNTGGCSATSTATTVTVNALPVITPFVQVNGGAWNQVTTATLCSGGTVVIGPQPNVATGWSWTGPNGYSSTSREITLANLQANQAGTYTATYTNASNCVTTTSFTITVNALPTATITTTTPTTFCQGGSVTLNANTGTGLTYQWRTGTANIAGATNASYTATASGDYNVQVSNANNCSATSTNTVVTVNATPTAPTTTAAPVYCQNATAVALSATGTNLKWYTVATGGTSTTTAPTPSTSTAGITSYYVSQTTNGCESSRTKIDVTINALPTATITTTTPTTFCQGGSVTLNANTGTGLTYQWYNGTTTTGNGSSTLSIYVSSGSYTVRVTNGNGCSATSTPTVVTVNATPTAPTITSPIIYCQNAVATSLSAPGANLKWYTVATGGTSVTAAPTPSTATAGTTSYYVSQTTNGCESARAQIDVTVNPTPTATITTTTPTTIVEGGSVTLTANTGTGLSYQWRTGTTNIAGATNASYTATTAGSYSVVVTNVNNCSQTSSATTVTVNANAPSQITIVSPQANTTQTGSVDIEVNITDSDGSIVLVEYLDGTTVIGTSSTSPYNFTWTNPTVGSHEIRVRVTDSNGGVTTSSAVNIDYNPLSTGVQSMNTLKAIVYPNPTSGEVIVETQEDLSKSRVRMIDVWGNEIEVIYQMTGQGLKIDMSGLSSGSYVLVVSNATSILRTKMTVIK
ncbi:MAG: sugar-binding protein [Cytophagaceae bacterium]